MSDKLLQPSSGPGRPKDPAKRQAILEAAKCLFIQNGYDGSSMDAIAAEAGVSKLTVYSHFTDKETLFAYAIESKCSEQLPPLFFELAPSSSVQDALLAVGRGFSSLINSDESLAMHRLMVAQGIQNPGLVQLFYNAGPLRILQGMQRLLEQANTRGLLRVSNTESAAEHFCCLIKGGYNFRLLMGINEPLSPTDAEAHIQEVVELFMRAYSP